MKRIDVSLILACYNEAGLFAESVRRIKDVLDFSRFTYEIIFVDDHSRDGTKELIRDVIRGFASNGAEVGAPWFSHRQGPDRNIIHQVNDAKAMTVLRNGAPPRAIFHRVNQGRGGSVVDGIKAAKGSVVGYIDIDCEVSPVYIPHMVSLILQKKADVVIGRRFYRTSPSSLIREVLSRGYQWLSDRMIGTGGLDTETGYKFFARKKIVPILSKTKHPGWFWDTEIMVYARRAGLKITEVPVLFLRRFDKHSSVNIFRDTIDYLVQLIRFRRSLR
ncbi:MAG TPA: glycosyltransferase family 2 protein [Patescibacteria group bacterium]|nr:glycosyltransferase family 2 protein [Patescibacteria group bacterium]